MDHKMKSLLRFALFFLLSFFLVSATVALAQRSSQRQRHWHDDDTHMRRNGVELEIFRETVEKTVAATSGARIKVDPDEFGGIMITGWDREEVKLVAKKKAAAITQDEARDIASKVQIIAEARGGAVDIRAEGPRRHEDTFWSVSFELFVPKRSDLDLRAKFGGISIEEVSGDIRFNTEFGGIDLSRVSGSVVGETKFGGVTVELEGDQWNGERLDVSTKFGGITARIPRGYSAELEMGTSFGSLNVDFPITVQGRIRNTKEIKTQIGFGGAPIRLVTEFGGVSIKER